MRLCPDLIDEYIKFTEGHESTDRVRKWSIISVIAGALERRVWLDRGYYTLFPNLYVFIIGKSGLIKKSTSTAIAVNLLRELSGIKLMSERLTAASLISQLSSAGKYYELDGKKVKQSPLFAYASELAVFLVEVFGSITELLTTFYDCQPNDSSKPWIHHTKTDGATNIYGPCLNVLGASTKTWLKKCITKSEMEGGFTSRIIFVVENNLPDQLIAWPIADAEVQKIRTRIVTDLKTIFQLKGEFHVEPLAKEHFTSWYAFHMKEVLPLNMDPRMAGYMSRKGDTILKLAMIKSAAQGDTRVISKEHMMWAQSELDDLEKDWRDAFEDLGMKSNLAWEVRNYVRSRGTVSKKEIFMRFTETAPQAEVGKVLIELTAMGEIAELPPMGPNDPGHYTNVLS